MTITSARFPDITNHWARPFIEALARRGILNGYPDGTFRPDNSVTRAEFAAIITTTFSRITKKREYVAFQDVADNYWAAAAIRKAYETVFITGFPNNYFRPTNRIQRIHALLSIISGLGMTSKVSSDLLPVLGQIYQDAQAIPDYAKPTAAITTRAGMVVSYPNPKLLNPTLAATRADISAFVYQALVWLGEEEKIASPYIVQPPENVNVPTPPPGSIQIEPNREFRGAWVASVWNSDWPSRAGLSIEQQKAELIQILDQLQELNFNALILQVRPEGDALYNSKYEPWSAWLTGTQGKAPGYDPLEFAIAECHKRNIEFHAWFNPYRASTSHVRVKNVAPHLAVTNPEVVYRWGTQLWMDPGAKVVQDRAYNVIMDVVQRYDIDGIHLDDYFYPYPISGESFPDSKTYAADQNAGGKLSLNDWRRDNVNRMMQRLWQGIKSVKSHVKFGISPFGIYRPGEPSGIQGLDAYSVLYADAKKWLQEGWLDYIAPQLYWRIDQTAQSYPILLEWWTSINSKQRHVYAGNTIARLDGEAWTQEEILKQVAISRSLNKSLSLGNIFFSVNAIKENRQNIADKFKSLLYKEPALVPVMQWQNTLPPASPIKVETKNRKITWATGGGEIRSWTLYKKTGNDWKLQRILSQGTTAATVEPGTYAVCAVNRIAVQSAGVIISV
ncbi:MAG: family 10 glycosylhydrolase [Rivularia sp. T60_A2020_040]|nr:family 10 glycosylhydrolase [Rivularia sp. T60_A2020_040]